MKDEARHISVCICTFKRPSLLRQLLVKLERQRTDGKFTYSIVVADNDKQESARQAVSEFLDRPDFSITYCVEPRQNIALVRNMALAHADGEFVALIDDDEFPQPDWLLSLFDACEEYQSAGVLGPVLPHFEETPPSWVTEGGFYVRPLHSTGSVMNWEGCRTGNVLLRRRILDGKEEVFQPRFGTGGEDQDFFRRMILEGHVFVWCNDAAVHEHVPPSRWERSFVLKRALLRGRNSLLHESSRRRNLLKSVVAIPMYAVLVPVLWVVRRPLVMKYLVKLSDHAGRLLALVGLNPVSEREM